LRRLNVVVYTMIVCSCFYFFFFQAEDGIRDRNVTGVQTCALPISTLLSLSACSLPFQLPEGDSTLTCRITDKQEKLLTVEVLERSEERRVGKESRSRWGRDD